MSRAAVVLALGLLSCTRPSPSGGRVMVVAPHPDDETLLAAGVMRRAFADGLPVSVVVMTNGDLGCGRDGRARQRETLRALEVLGLRAASVAFLGYPDGYLDKLGPKPLPPIERRTADGGCGLATGTYPLGVDEHSRRTGASAPYTDLALMGDLLAVIDRFQPSELYLPHGIDTHPDHAMTYAFVRRALAQRGQLPVTLHRGVVHAGDECWPSDCKTMWPNGALTPPLPAPLTGYLPDEHVLVEVGKKAEAIGEYRSQLEGPLRSEWLVSFARQDEAFYTEPLGEPPRWAPAEPSLGLRVALEKASVVLYQGSRVLRRWTSSVAEGSVALATRLRGDFVEVSVRGPRGFLGQVVIARR